MEKFSIFRDPVTGINPFTAHKQVQITTKMVLKTLIKLPIYILYLLGFPVVGILIKINKKSEIVPKHLIHCNMASQFDISVLKSIYKIQNFRYIPGKTCLVFPEETSTNNQAILSYSTHRKADYTVGLRYSENCIFCYGSRVKWLVRFLGADPRVDVFCIKGDDLEKATGLPKVRLTAEDKKRFLKMLNGKEDEKAL